jgi:DNA segregation ATPase FtsK/SpoIIIE-like protein
MKTFRAAGVYKIDEYNSLPGITPLHYIFLVLDEYAEARRQKDFEEDLQSALQIGRAGEGFRALIATQRPSADNISTSIRD